MEKRRRERGTERGIDVRSLPSENPDPRGCSVFHDLANISSLTADDRPMVLRCHVQVEGDLRQATEITCREDDIIMTSSPR